jgi:hypothetical protein
LSDDIADGIAISREMIDCGAALERLRLLQQVAR